MSKKQVDEEGEALTEKGPPLLRQVPCQRYLLYLLARGTRLPEIGERCESLRLIYGGEDFLQALHLSLELPDPFRPNSRTHEPSQTWLKEHGIAALFPSPWPAPAEAAFRLIQKPRAKEALETLLLAGSSREGIVLTLRRLGIQTSEETLLWAERLFWDISAMEVTELRAVLQMRAPSLAQVFANPYLAKKVERAMYRDPRLLLADVPKGPAAVLVAQTLLGVPQQKMNLEAFYQMMLEAISLRAMEAIYANGKDASFELLNYTSAAKAIADIKERLVKPDKQAQEGIQRATIVYRQQRQNSPALTEGNHQVSPYIHVGEQEPTKRAEQRGPRQEGGAVQRAEEKVLRREVGAQGACSGP